MRRPGSLLVRFPFSWQQSRNPLSECRRELHRPKGPMQTPVPPVAAEIKCAFLLPLRIRHGWEEAGERPGTQESRGSHCKWREAGRVPVVETPSACSPPSFRDGRRRPPQTQPMLLEHPTPTRSLCVVCIMSRVAPEKS